MQRKLPPFFIFFIFFAYCSYAQNKLVFHRLTGDNGLSSHAVIAILQDKKGFMWFGSYDGLNRYDGYTVKNYFLDPRDTNSLSSSYINCLFEDKKGFLWIGTNYGGLNRYDQRKQKFKRYLHDEKNPNSISDNVITSICQDDKGSLWIGSESGINILDPETGIFTKYRNNAADKNSISAGAANFIFFDAGKTAWIGTEKGTLNKFDSNTNTFSHFNFNDSVNSAIFQIDEYGKDTLVICSYAGLRFFNKATGQFFNLLSFIDKYDPLLNRASYSLYKESESVFWFSNIPKNNFSTLVRIDLAKKTINRYLPDPNVSDALSNENIHDIYKDRSGTIWLGSNGKGVNYFNQSQIKFFHLKRDDNKPNFLRSEYVYPMYEDFDGSIWIGTSDGGLNHYFPGSGKMEYFDKGIFLNKVSSICDAGNGKLWVGLWRRSKGALILLDKKTGSYQEVKTGSNGKSLSDEVIKVVKVSKDGIVWIGTQTGGLNRYDPKTGAIEYFKHFEDSPGSVISNEIKDIFEDETGNLWLATGEGLDHFNIQKKQFIHYKYDPKNPSSLSNDYVMCVIKDSKKNIWVGTSYGLNRLDTKTGKFKTYTTVNGMPNNFVYGILEDNSANLWISTNNGLTRFDPVKEHFRNFEVSDGLQSKEFNTYAFHKGRSGRMYFGGVNGLNSFFPDSLKDEEFFVPVILTSFKKFGKEIQMDTSITYKKHITLDYFENFFSLEFASIDYLLPYKNKYSCMMEGLDKNWILLGTQHNISYTNLDPGEYIFKVRNTNTEGYWNPQETSIRITILPPFWKTKWFYLLCVVFSLSAIFLIYRLRVRSLLKSKALLEKQVKERTLEIEQQKILVEKQKDEVENQKNLIEEKNREIIDSITYAKRLQDAILPPFSLIKETLPESFIFYKPKDIVAGDFYWAEQIDNTLFIAAADCTGHGVPGAMVSLVCSNALNTVVKEFGIKDPGQVLDKAAKLLVETFQKSDQDVKDGMDISLLKLEFKKDKKEISIEWAGANNPLWICKSPKTQPFRESAIFKQEADQKSAVAIPSHEITKIKPNKQPIGKYDHMKPFTTHDILYEKGMMLYLFTDGYPDQFGGARRKKFMYHQFEELFLSICDKPVESQRQILEEVFENWRGDTEQIDDVTVIGIRL